MLHDLNSNLSNQLVISDANALQHIAPFVNGQRVCRGLVPRNMTQFPRGFYSSGKPSDIKLIPLEQFPSIINKMETSGTRISDIRRRRGHNGKHIPSLDQNGQGFCWAYDAVAGLMLVRALANLPYVRLSAHAVACKIMNFRDRGGWAALAQEFIYTNGCPSVDMWAEKSMNRQYDTATTWEEAKKYKHTEEWVDLASPHYDRNMSFHQVLTCLLNRQPVCCDFMWWGHSTIMMDVVDAYPSKSPTDLSRYGIRGLNSWTDNYGDLGEFVLVDSRARPDNATSILVPMGN